MIVERTGMWLRKVEHIRGHLWDKYTVTINPEMLETVKLSKVTISTKLLGTLRSVASLLAATLYQGNLDRNHKL